MGQATLDPAVVDAAAPSGEATKTDVMLSQMVGEEVDRLLAEAEAERAAIAAAAAQAAPSTSPAPAAPFDDLVVGLPQPGGAPAVVPPPAATVAAEDVAMAARLDKAISGLTEPAPDPPPAAAAAPAPVIEPAPAPAEEAAEEARLKTLAVELEVDPAAPVAAPPVDGAMAEPPAAVVEEVESIPLLIRPLVWMNAPLVDAPEFLRSFMGNAAILTFINATVILIYVAIVRRHTGHP